MNGMLFNSHFMTAFVYTVLSFYLVDVLLTLLVRSDKDEPRRKDRGYRVNGKLRGRKNIQAIIMVFAIFTAILLAFKPLTIGFSAYAVLVWIVILPIALRSLIQYISGKPSDYVLTKTRENALCLVGTVMLFVCARISATEARGLLNKFLLCVKPVVADFLMMVLLTFWHFIVMFFTLSFLVLTLQKISILLGSRIGDKVLENSKGLLEEKGHKPAFLADQIAEQLDVLPKGKLLQKVFYYLLWFICVVLDGMIVFLQFLFSRTLQLIMVIILFIPRMFRCGVRYLSNTLNKNQGKAIIAISRISLIGSLLYVYLMDKYQQVFSMEGSEIYEFLCSVIIIPLLITPLLELKGQWKDVKEQ